MKLTSFAFALISTSLFCLVTADAEVSIISDDFSSGSINTTNAGDFGSVGIGRSQSTGTWALSGGSLINTGTDPRGLGYIVDVSSLAVNSTYDILNLSFDYTSGSASDSLFVHIYGYQNGGGTPKADSLMVNMGATKGNAWTNKVDRDAPSKDHFIITNFVNGAAQGKVRPYRGDALSAFKIAGKVGFQTIEKDFSLSSIISGGPKHLDDYDYLALVLTRRIAADSSDTTIDNLNLTVETSKSDDYVDIPEPRTYALLASVVIFSLVVLRRRLDFETR